MNSLKDFKSKKINATTQSLMTAPKKLKRKDMGHFIIPERAEIVMLDLLHLPTDPQNFKYALIAVDLCTSNVDAEPMIDKSSGTALKAFKLILKRKFIKLPRYMVITDDGGEFKLDFDKYLKANKIIHRTTVPEIHRQMTPVDSKCSILGKYLMEAMASKEDETGVVNKIWRTNLTDLIKILNKPQYIRKQEWSADKRLWAIRWSRRSSYVRCRYKGSYYNAKTTGYRR